MVNTIPTLAISGGSRLWREALAARIQREDDFRVVSVVATHEELPKTPSAQLWICCGDFDGQALSELLDFAPADQLVLIVGRPLLDASAPLDAIAQGRLVWTQADAPLDVVLTTIRRLTRGEPQGSPQLIAALAQQVQFHRGSQPSDGECRPILLTARERTIAVLAAEGLLNKQIAKRLGIRVATVKSHLHTVMRKLQVRRRGNLVYHVGLCHAVPICPGSQPC